MGTDKIHDPLCESLRPFPGSTLNPCNCDELEDDDDEPDEGSTANFKAMRDYVALLNGQISIEEYRLLDSGLKLIEHVRADERKKSEGPGTPTMRWHLLMDKLEARFPNPEPFRSDRVPEEHYIVAIDALLARAGPERNRPKLAIMFSEPRTLICEATPEALCIAEAQGDDRAERETNARFIVACVNGTTK